MAPDKKLTSAVGGKPARACDKCIRKRACCYCVADDAFLCQSCDSSVHSAIALARRHQRVRLKTSSINPFDDVESAARFQVSAPSWHQGFTRKARTPRQKRHGKLNSTSRIKNNLLHLVPQIGSEEYSQEGNEEQLLSCRVPIFDPFAAELRPSCNSSEASVKEVHKDAESTKGFVHMSKAASSSDFSLETNNLEGFLVPSEMVLSEFAADVESLLGEGLEDEPFDMEGLGLLNCNERQKESKDCSNSEVKVEDGEVEEMTTMGPGNHQINLNLDMGRETFELNLDYDPPNSCEKEDGKAHSEKPTTFFEGCKVGGAGKTLLRLDYDSVFSAWGVQKSPWTTTRERPELNSSHFWPDSLQGISGGMHAYGETGVVSRRGTADGWRAARVSRYREKRRTRLFAKKIRYQVRKRNAEKRPRMKGRFVKRASVVPPAFPLLG